MCRYLIDVKTDLRARRRTNHLVTKTIRVRRLYGFAHSMHLGDAGTSNHSSRRYINCEHLDTAAGHERIAAARLGIKFVDGHVQTIICRDWDWIWRRGFANR
ncbi:MAG: hypothetical protein JOZ65_07160 [Chloroflexi bacterium]|nr:hypothetical protein [Chloroflexota bacterium]